MYLIQIGSATVSTYSRRPRLRLVEADPDAGHVVGAVAGEPAILGIVGGAGLTGQVGALQRQVRRPVPR